MLLFPLNCFCCSFLVTSSSFLHKCEKDNRLHKLFSMLLIYEEIIETANQTYFDDSITALNKIIHYLAGKYTYCKIPKLPLLNKPSHKRKYIFNSSYFSPNIIHVNLLLFL